MVRTTPLICGRQASETMAMRNLDTRRQLRGHVARQRRRLAVGSPAQRTMRSRPSKSSTSAVQLSTQSPSLR
jgi:hypothetical protein